MKRFLSAILCIAMVLSTMSFPAIAEDADVISTGTIEVNDSVYSSLEEAIAAAGTEAATIKLAGESYTMPSSVVNKNITITGVEGTVVEMLTAVNAAGSTITFENVTVKFDNDGYEGLQHSAKIVYKNCTHIGTQFLYAPVVEFTGCTFEMYDAATEYAVWTYGASDVTFTGCTFNTNGKAILVYTEAAHTADINLTGCDFYSNGTFTGKAAVELGQSANGSATYTLSFDECTADENFSTNNSSSNLWGNKNNMGAVEGTDDGIGVQINGESVDVTPAVPEAFAAKIGDNTYATLQDAINAAADGDEIMLYAGTHVIANTAIPEGKSLTFTGAEAGVILDESGLGNEFYGTNYVFNDLEIIFPNTSHRGFTHCEEIVYNDCTFIGTQTLYADKVVFNNCIFNPINETSEYAVWTYGASDVTFTGCTFNTNGKAILVYTEGAHTADIKLTGCDFYSTGAHTGKAAVELGQSDNGSATYTLSFDECTADENFSTNNSSSNLWGNKNSIDTDSGSTVVIDNVEQKLPDPALEGANVVTIGSAADFDAFAAAVNGQTTYQGVQASWNANLYVRITADIDMSAVTFTTAIGGYGNAQGGFSGTLDGQGHKLYNYTVSGNWNYARALFRQASNITVKNITFDNFRSDAADAADIKTRPAGIIFASVLGTKNVFQNVTLTNSVLYGDNGLGTLMGYGSGDYSNAFVTEYIFDNCTVKGCTIYSETDRAAILGEFGRDGDVILTITNCDLSGNKLIATIDGATTESDLPVWYNHAAAAIEKDGKIYTYEFVDTAIEAALANGGTVVLAKDIALTEAQAASADTNDTKFNLSGYALTVPDTYETTEVDGIISVSKKATNWIEVADTAWYTEENKTVEEYVRGESTFTQDTYVINTAEELAGLAKLVNEGNTFSAVVIKLGSNIDLTAYEWTPIGLTSSTPFRGHFDGQNNTITGLNIETAYDYAGLFGYVRNQTSNYLTSFENITFNNVNIKNGENSAALFGDANFSGSNNHTGGVIQIHNVTLTGNIVIEGTNAGGLVGSGWLQSGIGSSNILIDADSYSYIYGSSCAGGVFASSPHNRGTENIVSNITVKGEGIVGGIAGKAGWIWDDVTFTGNIESTSEDVGLIFGQISDNSWWANYGNNHYGVDYSAMTGLNAPDATINDQASTRLFSAKGGFGGTFVYEDGKVTERFVVVTIDGVGSELMTWKEASAAVAGKTATITIASGNGSKYVYGTGLVVAEGSNVTIDLGGKTVEGLNTVNVAVIENNGTVSVINGSVERFDNATKGYYVIDNNGTMTLNCSVWNNSGIVDGWAGSSLIENTGKLTIDGGEYTNGRFICVKNDDGGELIINDGTFSVKAPAEGYTSSAIQNWGDLTVNGGTYTGAVWTAVWSDAYNASTTINGGTINGNIIASKAGETANAANVALVAGDFTNATIEMRDADAVVTKSAELAIAAPEGYKWLDDTTLEPIVIEYWIELADTDWYTDGKDEFIITTAEELAGLAKLVNEGNNFSGKTIKLGADIDLAAYEWTPIGTSNTLSFVGNLDGQEYTVSNLNIDEAEKHHQALFGYAAGNIKNLNIHNVSVNALKTAAALVGGVVNFGGGNSGLVFENITVTGDVRIIVEDFEAAIFASTGTATPLSAYDITVNVNSGSVVSNEGYTGTNYENIAGLFGNINCKEFKNISSNIDVVGQKGAFIGGIVSRAGGNWENVTHTGNVTIISKDTDPLYENYFWWQTTGLVSGAQTKNAEYKGISSTGTLTFNLDNTNTNGVTFYDTKGNAVTDLLGAPSKAGVSVTIVAPPIDWTGCTECSIDDPHIITTAEELDAIRTHVVNNVITGFFKLGNDIEFTAADFAEGGDFYNAGEGWQAIGHNNVGGAYGSSNGISFNGSFDGNGKTISGIVTTRPSNWKKYNGLFAFLAGDAHVFNVTLKDFAITGDMSGVLTGMVNSENAIVETITLDNCTLTTVGLSNIASGLLVGKLQGGTVQDITIKNSAYNGGSWGSGYIVGLIQNSTLKNVTVENCTMESWTKNAILIGTIQGNWVKIENISITNSEFIPQHTDGFAYIAYTFGVAEPENSYIKNVNVDVTVKGSDTFFAANKKMFEGLNKNIVPMEDVNFSVLYDVETGEDGSVNMVIDGSAVYVTESTFGYDKPVSANMIIAYTNGGTYTDGTLVNGDKILTWYDNAELTGDAVTELTAGNTYYANWAEPPVTNWIQVADTDWYTGDKDEYTVTTAEELAGIAKLVNEGITDFAGKKLLLGADIDLAAYEWTPIGFVADMYIKGSFDGQGHTISNLNIDEPDTVYTGFIGRSALTEIKNLTIDNANVAGGGFSAVLVAKQKTSAVATDINFTGDIFLTTSGVEGGLLNANGQFSLIKNIRVDVNEGSYAKSLVTSTDYWEYFGGVWGHTWPSVAENIYSNIDVYGYASSVGGIGGGCAFVSNNIVCDGDVIITIDDTELYRGYDCSMRNGLIYGFGSTSSNYAVYMNCSATGTLTVAGEVITDLSQTDDHNTAGALAAAGYKANDVRFGAPYYAAGTITLDPVAMVGTKYYSTLDAAIAAAAGNTVTLVDNVTLSETLTIAADQTAVIDLAGKQIIGTDESTSGSYELIANKGNLTVKDSVGGGEIALTATADRDWNAYSAVIANLGGTLTVESGAIHHLGGTDMAYAIDNNSTLGDTTLTVNGGEVLSDNYRAVRMFANSTTNANTVTVNGGTVKGGSAALGNNAWSTAIWMQSPSAAANSAALTVSADAKVGSINVYAPEGADASNMEASISGDALIQDDPAGAASVLDNLPEGYEIANNNGIYGIDAIPEEAPTLGARYGSVRVLNTAENRVELYLFSGIDTLDYKEVGFIVKVGNESKTLSTRNVYKNIKVKMNDVPTTLTASDFSKEGYEATWIFGQGINFGLNFAKNNTVTYQPYAITLDGETIYGAESAPMAIYAE